MHFSKSVTIAPLFAAAAMASPGKSLSQRDAAMALDNVRQAIHSEGVEWTETSNGNRFATIPAGTTPAKRFLDLPAGLGSFFDIGEVMGRDVDVACYHMGYWMDTSIIKDNAATICADLVAQTALGQAADGSWNVVKRLGVLPEDKNADLNFMWRWMDTTSTDKLTTQMCEALTDKLFQDSTCNNGGSSAGAFASVNQMIDFAIDPWMGA